MQFLSFCIFLLIQYAAPNAALSCTVTNPSTELCCMNTLVDISGITDPVCCGTDAVECASPGVNIEGEPLPPPEICCDDTVKSTSGFVFPQCCNGYVIEGFTNLCCAGIVRDITQIFGEAGCCGDQAMNLDTQICCGILETKIVDLPGPLVEPTCCERSAFDAASGLCCDGVIHTDVDTDNYRCCGTAIYNRRESDCENGVVVPDKK